VPRVDFRRKGNSWNLPLGPSEIGEAGRRRLRRSDAAEIQSDAMGLSARLRRIGGRGWFRRHVAGWLDPFGQEGCAGRIGPAWLVFMEGARMLPDEREAKGEAAVPVPRSKASEASACRPCRRKDQPVRETRNPRRQTSCRYCATMPAVAARLGLRPAP
jgi:hypothetical protein